MNQTVAMEESGMLEFPWIWIRRVVWWRWMVRVPMTQAGTVAVLRLIFRRRFTRRPLVSIVSIPLVDTVATMPWVVNE